MRGKRGNGEERSEWVVMKKTGRRKVLSHASNFSSMRYDIIIIINITYFVRPVNVVDLCDDRIEKPIIRLRQR